MEDRKQRSPAKEKRISELSKEDIRVAIVGTVVEKEEQINSIVINDSTGTIRAMMPADFFNKVQPGQLIRIIGIVAPALEGSDFELKGELTQDFSRLDKELYSKYLKLK